jgi:hypothetical protein
VSGRARSGGDWLQFLQRRLERYNVDVQLGTPEAVQWLTTRRAEADTIADGVGATLLFRDPDPSASAVLEEFAHVMQARQNRFVDEYADEMNCLREVEVKGCLVEHRRRLGIREEEDLATRLQLKDSQRELERLRQRWK